MKTLIFFRHGKSDWNSTAGSDHERPLNERGTAAAQAMGRFLQNSGQTPTRALSSSAVRAYTTLEIAREAGEWHCEVRVTPQLYDSTPELVLTEIQKEDDGADSLLLVGHEPTWSRLVALFTGADVRFPTAAMARIDSPATAWSEVSFESGALSWLVLPKLFLRGDPDVV